MALTKVRGGGVDNPLTLGGGAASDRSIIFDGNAQDFHIGLDDSADSLTIGLGSALGTTSHMVFDANGHITKPLQPAFRAYKNANQYNFAVNTTHTITFGAETFDNNGDFASNTFTAPVTGRYLLGFHLRLESPNQSQVYTDIKIVTSNRSSQYLIDEPSIGSADYYTATSVQLFDMDANDTATITLYNSGGTAGMDITGFEQHGLFYGHLVC